MVNKLIIAVICSVILKCVTSQTIPDNPCPNLFQYFQNNGIVYGRMEFPNDFSGYYTLSVNMSLAAYITDKSKNIQLEIRTSASDLVRGLPVTYHVYFPFQEVIPKLTRVEFNRRIYCSGPPEELIPGRGVTSMWAATYFRVTVPFRPQRPNSVDFEIQKVPELTFTELPDTFLQSTTSGTFEIPFFTVSTQRPTPFVPAVTTPRPTPPIIAPPVITTTTTTTKRPFIIEQNLSGSQCGLSGATTQQLIINGENVDNGQYPWLVALMYRKNFNYNYKCTGTLISNQHVITAGHCVQYNFQDTKVPLFAAEDLLLVLGKHNIENWANGAVLRDVKKITVHPEYKQNRGDCDVAVLTLDKPVQFDNAVRPICLWQDNANLDRVVGIEGTVAGWGRDETGKEFVVEAKRINLPIVSQVACLRSHPGFSSITSNRTFCAGNRNGSGPCHGDSGAGYMINQNGRWMLRGVVSTALGDVGVCDLNNYFVFADVAKVMSWVKEAIA